MRLDSRTVVVEACAPTSVVTSSHPATQRHAWIQPSISQAAIGDADYDASQGVYIHAGRAQMDPWRLVNPVLAEELEAWEMASDEALAHYEACID